MMGIKQERLFSENLVESAIHPCRNKGDVAQSPTTMIHSTLAGISSVTAGLAWKGYVYAPGILFLGYSGIVFLNLFRGRDTLPITATMLQMLSTAILIPLPFYIWPGMGLLTDPSGMAPLLYMLGFTHRTWIHNICLSGQAMAHGLHEYCDVVPSYSGPVYPSDT